MNGEAEVLRELRRPFTPDAIRWKVQSTWGPKDGPRTGGMVVPYVDARTVIARLDHVAGLDWQDETVPVAGEKYAVTCDLTIGETIRSDIGESTHSLKAAASDGLKRAAVRFGVGLSIYAMNRVMLNASENGFMEGKRPTLKQKSTRGKHTLELTDVGERWLRDKYAAWIKKQNFGEALDHGDTVETLGLEGADQLSLPAEEVNFTGLEGVGIPTSPELLDQVAAVVNVYGSLTTAQRRGLSKAKFKAQLTAAAGSADELAKLEDELNHRTKGTTK